MKENQIGTIVVRESVEIHKDLGPGLLETVYEKILCAALQEQGFKVSAQIPIPIRYKGIQFNEGFRADLIVENKVILELKSVESVSRLHHKQLNTYLKLTNMKLGYLLNFGAVLMSEGISRVVNGLEE